MLELQAGLPRSSWWCVGAAGSNGPFHTPRTRTAMMAWCMHAAGAACMMLARAVIDSKSHKFRNLTFFKITLEHVRMLLMLTRVKGPSTLLNNAIWAQTPRKVGKCVHTQKQFLAVSVFFLHFRNRDVWCYAILAWPSRGFRSVTSKAPRTCFCQGSGLSVREFQAILGNFCPKDA